MEYVMSEEKKKVKLLKLDKFSEKFKSKIKKTQIGCVVLAALGTYLRFKYPELQNAEIDIGIVIVAVAGLVRPNLLD
jgi:hypothetical protein